MYMIRCIRGILSDKVVILVTHQIQYLEQCDTLLGLKDVRKQLLDHNILMFIGLCGSVW